MIKINGKECSDVVGMTVSAFLKREGYSEKFIAVECNDEIVPKLTYPERVLQDGDVLEVVQFVGGG